MQLTDKRISAAQIRVIAKSRQNFNAAFQKQKFLLK